jgi:DNA-directed RNA polymerase II subunit RPB2
MEAATARHIAKTYFTGTANPLTSHHIDSYNDFLEFKIPTFLRGSNPMELLIPGETSEESRTVRIFLGTRAGTKFKYIPIQDMNGNAILPHQCRTENMTYSIELKADIEIEYSFAKGDPVIKVFEDVTLAKLPLMVRSKYCYLYSMTPEETYEAGECYHELGGYFIIDGAERVLLTQERLGNNLFYAGKREYKPPTQESDYVQVGGKVTEKGEEYEYYAGIRSVSEDGTRGPFSHYLVLPPSKSIANATLDGGVYAGGQVRMKDRIPVITLPGFKVPVPVLSVLRAMGCVCDKDIYDTVLAGLPDAQRTIYDDILTQIIIAHDTLLGKLDTDRDPDMLVLGNSTKTTSESEAMFNLQEFLFPHVEIHAGEGTGELFRRKSYLVGHMLRMALDIALELRPQSDRDHFKFKRFDVSGDLCFQMFTRIYKEVSKRMLTEIDARVLYESALYSGRKIVEILEADRLNYYWKYTEFANQFSKGFKGKWAGMDGVSQILSRVSYVGAVSHLRRCSLQMDSSSKILGARRLHGSSFGFTCPSDVPDGRNVGMIKHLSLLTSVSTATPSSAVYTLLTSIREFMPLAMIHPSRWDSSWTRVFLNGDIVGVLTGNTPQVFRNILAKRVEGALPQSVSIGWERQTNEISLSSDPGRPLRPVYRPSITPAMVLQLNKWNEMLRTVFDLVDSQEAETLLISLQPFHKKLPSEIHGLFLFSPLAAIIPYSAHNPSPRTSFSCQQSRQGVSWFHSNFKKRFDTVAVHLHNGQRPICETWMYPYILGRGGCMPYGENAIVAVATYGGYNQDDSVILNADAMRRGMFHMSYYHSYTITTASVDPALQINTEFAGVETMTKYGVKRKEGKDYSKLDENGIIRLNAEVTEDTVLVGILAPRLSGTGTVIGHVDVSELPKRAQRGRVDAIQLFNTSDGLNGIKIRIAEERSPILGDKVSSRAGQKGTCGILLEESDMPFTAKGVRPDLIFNPHGIPSRMTTGHLLECAAGKLGVELGTIIDGTPFTYSNHVEEYRKMLVATGMQSYGNEILYNGMTGEMMEVEIFMGPIYYLRSKLMVEDKINYRDTGPRALLTHQPLEGRASNGGLRIGEMERDGLIAHGVAGFIQESFMQRSDGHEVLFQQKTGFLDTTEPESKITTLDMPYAMSLYIKELEAMHIQPRLSIQNA